MCIENDNRERGKAMSELKANVEKLAIQEGKTEIEIITALQSEAAKLDDDELLLGQLIELKSQYIEL